MWGGRTRPPRMIAFFYLFSEGGTVNAFISPRFDEGRTLRLMAPSRTTLWMNANRERRKAVVGEVRATLTYLTMRVQTYTGASDIFQTPRFAYYYATWHVIYQEAIVARKVQTQAAQERTSWQGFLDHRMTEDELADADNWTPSEADIWEEIEEIINTGIRVQLSYSTKLGMATCTLTDYRPGSRTAGYALSAQDANGALALKLAIYKHNVLLRGDWATLLTDRPRGRRG